MAHLSLLPGFGGRYSATFISTSVQGDSDEIDCSKCNQLAIQFNCTSPVGTVNLEQTFNGTDYAAVFAGSAAITPTDGLIILLDASDGPFGKIRVDGAGLTAGSAVLTLVGYPSQSVW